jgi:hypothetical protein
VFEVPEAFAANASSTRKPRFRAAHLLLRFFQRSSHCTPPRGDGSGFSSISKFALTSGTRWRDCRLFILGIEHVSMAVDDLPILRDWRVVHERSSASISISLMACGIVSGYSPPCSVVSKRRPVPSRCGSWGRIIKGRCAGIKTNCCSASGVTALTASELPTLLFRSCVPSQIVYEVKAWTEGAGKSSQVLRTRKPHPRGWFRTGLVLGGPSRYSAHA